MTNTEIWKQFKDSEYYVSSYGNIKSTKNNKESLLKPGLSSSGYLTVALSMNNKQTTVQVHQLVAIVFLEHVPCKHTLVINHKDFNKLNNNIDNLEIITARKNTSHKSLNHTSQYTGVYWNKKHQRWIASIRIKGRLKHLGSFTDELKASQTYQLHLNLLK